MIYNLENVDPKWKQDVIDLCGLPQTFINTCSCIECNKTNVTMQFNTDFKNYFNEDPILIVYDSKINLINNSHDTLCNNCEQEFYDNREE